jgi:hypothetical protein
MDLETPPSPSRAVEPRVRDGEGLAPNDSLEVVDKKGGSEDNADGDSAASPSGEEFSKKRKLEPSAEKSGSVKKYFDNEAEESSGDESGKSEPAQEEEGRDTNTYVYDGFVVRDGEESGSDDDLFESTQVKKKKRPKVEFKRVTKKITNRLDDEDYELIRDNMFGVGNSSDTRKGEGRAQEEREGMEEPEADDDIEPESSTAQPGIKPSSNMYYEDDYDSEMEDFIEDEFDGENDAADADGVPVPRPHKSVRRTRVRVGPTMDQLKDAADIFGDGYDEFDEDKEEAMEEEFEDDNLTEEERLKKSKDRMRLKYDRAVLVENFCTEQDDVIRQTDRPERFQSAGERVFPTENEIAEEAVWMGSKLFSWMMSNEGKEKKSIIDSSSLSEIVSSCRFVLQFHHIEQMEVPFIATYRKDYLHSSISSRHIWKMLEFDDLWRKLNAVKARLLSIITAVGDAAKLTNESRGNWVCRGRNSVCDHC